MRIGIVSNSPGEILGWAVPASIIFKKLNYQADLYLIPCMFATKKEFQISLKYGFFNKIYSPTETIRHIFFLIKKSTISLFIWGVNYGILLNLILILVFPTDGLLKH